MGLILDLERQGAEIVETKKGWIVRCPDGKTTIGIHSSGGSDHRIRANLRAEVRRAGLTWPYDGESFRGKKRQYQQIADNVDAAISRIYPEESEPPTPEEEPMSLNPTPIGDNNGQPWYSAQTIGRGSRPFPRSIANVRGAIQAMGEQDVDPYRVRELLQRYESGPTESTTIIATLYWLGYRYVPETMKNRGRGYQGLWRLDPELSREAQETLPLTVFTPEDPIVPPPEPITPEDPLIVPPEPITPEDPIVAPAEPITPEDPIEVQAVTPDDALAAAEELVREAERARDEARGYAERLRVSHQRIREERDQARASIERLQGQLARERSLPRAQEDGSWSVPLSKFYVPGSDVAQIAYAAYDAAGLEVSVLFRPAR